MSDDSDSVDLSDSDEGDYPVPKIGHGSNIDTNLVINDAFTKVKHWKKKYKRVAKEKGKLDTVNNTTQEKLKHLIEIKILYDELKINSDLEVRSLQMKLEHETDQAKRFQVLLKQNKTSLEEMSGKHRAAVDQHKDAESKLCQTKLDLAAVVSDKGRIEDELGNVKTLLQQTQQTSHQHQVTVQNQASKITEIQRELKLSKEQHTELLAQFREAEELCDRMDKRSAGLAQELQMLKTTSSTEITSIASALTSSKEECLRVVTERDSLTRDLTYTRQTLNETQERLRESEAGHKNEKRTAEEKTICLKQTEMSLEHMQAMFTEKEAQYKETVSRLTADITHTENELKCVKEDLREAQSHHTSLLTDHKLFKQTSESQSEATKRDHLTTLANERGAHQREVERLETKLDRMRETGMSDMSLTKPGRLHLDSAVNEAVIQCEQRAAIQHERDTMVFEDLNGKLSKLRDELKESKDRNMSLVGQVEKLQAQHNRGIETLEMLQFKENEEAKHAFELQLVKQRETFELEMRSAELKLESDLERKESELGHKISQLEANNSTLSIQISTVKGNLDQAILDKDGLKKLNKELLQNLSGEKEERLRVEFLLQAKESQLSEKEGWFREEFEKAERDKDNITRLCQQQSDKIQQSLDQALNVVDKAKGQQMSQLVEYHKAEMLKLYQEKKASLLERRDELERRDSEWGNKLTALEAEHSAARADLLREVEQRDANIRDIERERDLHKATNAALRQNVKKLHDDLNEREEVEQWYCDELEQSKLKDEELNNTVEKVENLEVQLEDNVLSLKEVKEKLKEEQERGEKRRREVEEVKDINNALRMSKINVEKEAGVLTQKLHSTAQENDNLSKAVEEQMNRVDWANNKMRLAQDKILRLKERLEAELSNKEGVQALRNEDRLKLDQLKRELEELSKIREGVQLQLDQALSAVNKGKEALQNNQISWGGKEQRYMNELKQGKERAAVLQRQLDTSLPNDKVDEMVAEHQSRVAGLVKEHEARVASLIAGHAVEVQRAEVERSGLEDKMYLLTTQLQEAKSELNSLRIDSMELKQLTKQHENLTAELVSTKGEAEKARTQHFNNEQQLRQNMQDMNRDVDNILAEYNDKYVQYTEQTEKQHKAELAQANEGVQALRGTLTHAIHNIMLTLVTINPTQSLRGNTSSTTNTQSEQIATLNTELGHLRATAEHLNSTMKSLEDEKARAIDRCNKASDEHTAVMKTNNELELEMSRQREAFKEEVRGLKNDMKTAENKHEVIQKKLLSAREQIGTLEREVRTLQSTLSEKTALHSKLDNDISLIKSENTILNHTTTETKESIRQSLTEIEGLKARIIVLQEENKSIRARSDETMQKLSEKDIAAQGVQNKLNETIQTLHVENLQELEKAQIQREGLQEKIYQVQNELSQVKFEKVAREGQIKALTEQIKMRDSKELEVKPTSDVSYFNPDDSERCKELVSKCQELEKKNQDLNSDNIMANNSVVQLKHALETEKEKMTAAEQAIKQTTDSVLSLNSKQGGVTEELFKAKNDIFKLEELLKLEKEKLERAKYEKEEFLKNQNTVEGTLAEYKDEVYKLKDQLKEERTLKASLEQQLDDKVRQIDSEAKLRLHLSAQLGTAAEQDMSLVSEKRKVEKLEEKIVMLLEQIEKGKRDIESEIAARKLAEGQLGEYSDKVRDMSGGELKVKNMKLKLATEREAAKKVQEELTRKVKKCQLALKDETKERKLITDSYLNLKSEVGEMQGKMTVLLSEADRLKIQRDEAMTERKRLEDDYSTLNTSMQRDYCPKTDTAMAKKDIEARSRVEIKRQLNELNMKLESENKSREAIDKYRTETEARIRSDLERSNRELKSQVEECNEIMNKNETQLLNISSENDKLKMILEEERRNSERMYSFREEEEVTVPFTRPQYQSQTNTNAKSTQDANQAWLAMKSRLNESLNRYMSPLTEQKNPHFSMCGQRASSPMVSPRPGPSPSPRVMRTSGDSFL